VRFTAPGTEAIEGGSAEFRMRPDGDVPCIEPWHGTHSPVGFNGKFRDKPGLPLPPPGEHRVPTAWVRLN
jgi:hypothetical protein